MLIAVICVFLALVVCSVVCVVSPRSRRWVLRVAAMLVGGLLAVYLVARGIAEFFILDYSDPESYAQDWGGPHLLGVLAVHSGPGLLVLGAAAAYLLRRRAHQRAAVQQPQDHQSTEV
ncbi:hypothetical protein SUDANB58_01578 [Streptomyces sp. enrichment culture]|uniref:hypothetical protein n=1 Tax=Streptomyces sp. enrichment culture TaxID=1795815 RepID=UPI003F568BF1